MAKITLRVPKTPVTIKQTLFDVAENVPFSIQMEALGGTAPYTFASSNKPTWTNLTPAGLLTGTPPLGTNGTDVIFDIVATDAKGATSL